MAQTSGYTVVLNKARMIHTFTNVWRARAFVKNELDYGLDPKSVRIEDENGNIVPVFE